MLISIIGLPWYIITIKVNPDISNVIIYSPFFMKISSGAELILFQWFYRADATALGVLCGIITIIPETFNRFWRARVRSIRDLRLLAMTLIIVILVIFASLLPIHVATASRLSLGFGLLLAGIGAVFIAF